MLSSQTIHGAMSRGQSLVCLLWCHGHVQYAKGSAGCASAPALQSLWLWDLSACKTARPLGASTEAKVDVAHGQISMAPAHRITTQIEDTNREVYHADVHGSSTMKGAAKC